MILIYAKEFPWKKWPEFARFGKENFQIARYL
jgi:hypothetical protein